jgi:GrpB-like predicted nucleotidyltransferase (UPF0157 family)
LFLLTTDSQTAKQSMKIILEDYQPYWVAAFRKESEILASVLADFGPAIEHIGSTSIPGLCSKPTIDILVGLHDEAQLDKTIGPMTATGYTYFRKYEPAMPYRRLFARLKALRNQVPPTLIDLGDEYVRGREFTPLANIHVLVQDTYHWKRHLAFRDYLRAHPDVRDEYGRLKRELSLLEFKDTNDYNAAKDSFIKRTQEQALAWYDSRRSE